MAEEQWMSRLQRVLLAYFQIEWVQVVNLVFYFLVEVVLFVFLTLLPIKITFNWKLVAIEGVNSTIDIVVVVIFTAHIYLYLNYELGKLVRNPEIQKKLLFQNKVVRMKWLNLLSIELFYDIVCLGVAIFEVVKDENNLLVRLLQLVYLAKIYKIKMFHDRFQNYIIGTSFYVVYNVFYGLFILLILVSYVGCIFYQIDHVLYNDNYQYPTLLWVNQSAWNDIIQDDFGVQLLYAIYWSIGTASASAYGDIAASAPPDVVYNILCLYFEGFLFGFYLSRIHSIPASIIQKENQLLDLFQKFQEHNNDIKSQGEHISQGLYFQILCSLEYQESSKKSLSEIQSILPEDYVMEIKEHIFHDFLNLNPLGMWAEPALKKGVCLSISEVVVEVGEALFDYKTVNRSDLIFLSRGHIHSYCQLDHSLQFSCHHSDKSLLNIFSFVTGLRISCVAAQLDSYCTLYIVRRKDFKQLLNIENSLEFNSLFSCMLSFQSAFLEREPIALLAHELTRKSSDILFLAPLRKAQYLTKVIQNSQGSNAQPRTIHQRTQLRSHRRKGLGRKGKVSVGVQCQGEGRRLEMDKVPILEGLGQLLKIGVGSEDSQWFSSV